MCSLTHVHVLMCKCSCVCTFACVQVHVLMCKCMCPCACAHVYVHVLVHVLMGSLTLAKAVQSHVQSGATERNDREREILNSAVDIYFLKYKF